VAAWIIAQGASEDELLGPLGGAALLEAHGRWEAAAGASGSGAVTATPQHVLEKDAEDCAAAWVDAAAAFAKRVVADKAQRKAARRAIKECLKQLEEGAAGAGAQPPALGGRAVAGARMHAQSVAEVVAARLDALRGPKRKRAGDD